MASGWHQRLSADVKTTAYLKFRRVYEDARKVHAEGRPLEARLVLSRCLLHVPPLLAAAKDDPIPDFRSLPEWADGRHGDSLPLLNDAFRRSSKLEDCFAAASALDKVLERRLPQPEAVWESGRMRFARGFSTDTLFFAESNLRILRWWDSRRDREEIVPAVKRFLDLVRLESPQSGREFRDVLLRACEDIPGLRGVLIFGSSAHDDRPWNLSGGKDVDLALIGRGLWFRRALCTRDGMRLDILRFPEALLKRGVEAEDDLINNALFAAEILRDDSGTCRSLQKQVQARYPGGKRRPRGEAREQLERVMLGWTQWAIPQGGELSDWIRLEAACSQVLKMGFQLGGRWFPADQDLCGILQAWTKEAAQRLGEYLGAEETNEASRKLDAVCEALCNADTPLSDRARAASRDRDTRTADGHSRDGGGGFGLRRGGFPQERGHPRRQGRESRHE